MIMLLITYVNATYLMFFHPIDPPAKAWLYAARPWRAPPQARFPAPGRVGDTAVLVGGDLSQVLKAAIGARAKLRGARQSASSKQASAVLLRTTSSRCSMRLWTRSSTSGSINCCDALLEAEGRYHRLHELFFEGVRAMRVRFL